MVDRLKAMAGDGGVEIAERARAVYQARTPRALSELRSAAEIGDLAAVARLAHSLIGLSQAVGAGAVSRFAASIQQAARAGRAPSDAEVARLSVALKETLVAMEAEPPAGQPVAPARARQPQGADGRARPGDRPQRTLRWSTSPSTTATAARSWGSRP